MLFHTSHPPKKQTKNTPKKNTCRHKGLPRLQLFLSNTAAIHRYDVPKGHFRDNNPFGWSNTEMARDYSPSGKGNIWLAKPFAQPWMIPTEYPCRCIIREDCIFSLHHQATIWHQIRIHHVPIVWFGERWVTWLSARLQYLNCKRIGDTAVLR